MISLLGLFLGREAAQGRIFDELRTLLGPAGADLVQTAIAKSSELQAAPVGEGRLARRLGRGLRHPVLFQVGKYLIGLYIGKASVGSAFGAAGSLVVLLGAELTRAFANRFGSRVVPDETAPASPGGSQLNGS